MNYNTYRRVRAALIFAPALVGSFVVLALLLTPAAAGVAILRWYLVGSILCGALLVAVEYVQQRKEKRLDQ